MHILIVLCGGKQVVTVFLPIALFAAPQLMGKVLSFLYSAGRASLYLQCKQVHQALDAQFRTDGRNEEIYPKLHPMLGVECNTLMDKQLTINDKL